MLKRLTGNWHGTRCSVKRKVACNFKPQIRECKFSDFSLISDFLRINECGMKLTKYGKNMDRISIVSKERLDSVKGFNSPSLKIVSKH